MAEQLTESIIQNTSAMNDTREQLLALIHNDSDFQELARELVWKNRGVLPLRQNLNAFFLIIMAIHIHIMQYGFACLEAGCVRAQSATNSMWKNCISAYVAALGFWLFGYAIAFGESAGGFVGTTYWALADFDDIYMWFFQFSFCATASTIMSGAIAERARVGAYAIAAFLMSTFYYPFVPHWAWNERGWLKVGSSDGIGYYDFGGSGIVHLTGGAASLAAILVVPARQGRWVGNNREHFYGHSTTLASLGAMILGTGFIGFTLGAQLHIDQPNDGYIIGVTAFNTMLAGGGGMLSVGMIIFLRTKRYPIMPLHCGLIAGNVAICAGCDVVDGWAALLIGFLAGLGYYFSGMFIEWLRLDDPIEAVAVHGGGGIVGIISTAFLKKDTGILYNWDARSGKLLGWQLCGTVVISIWSFVLTYIIFFLMNKLGILNAKSDHQDDLNIDDVHGHEPAYPDTFQLKRVIASVSSEQSNNQTPPRNVVSPFFTSDNIPEIVETSTNDETGGFYGDVLYLKPSSQSDTSLGIPNKAKPPRTRLTRSFSDEKTRKCN